MSVYGVKVRNTGIATAVAAPSETNDAGQCDGRIEFQNTSVSTIEISTQRDFEYGTGLRLSTGQSYYQEVNPDGSEWWAIADPGGGDNVDLRIIDTRRPKVG